VEDPLIEMQSRPTGKHPEISSSNRNTTTLLSCRKWACECCVSERKSEADCRPDEIWKLDLKNAVYYQFIAEDASSLGTESALSVLQRDGCRLATAPWVDNHYAMILWKLAGQVQAQPKIFDTRWNWGEVIEQLKYRYEREFGAAQRPIVRRIQEQDSSAGDGKPMAVKPYLELTDGWYRINAEIDDCLVRAVKKGKINVGRKMAICGARVSPGEFVPCAQDLTL
jgi:breast cancer 2 susceptibility protein